MIYFSVEQSPYSPTGEWVIKTKEYIAKQYYPITGSLNMLFARIMGLTYAEFLRYMRDHYGARLTGKNHTYPFFYFPTQEAATAAATELDNRYLEINKLSKQMEAL